MTVCHLKWYTADTMGIIDPTNPTMRKKENVLFTPERRTGSETISPTSDQQSDDQLNATPATGDHIIMASPAPERLDTSLNSPDSRMEQAVESVIRNQHLFAEVLPHRTTLVTQQDEGTGRKQAEFNQFLGQTENLVHEIVNLYQTGIESGKQDQSIASDIEKQIKEWLNKVSIVELRTADKKWLEQEVFILTGNIVKALHAVQ